MSKFLAQLDPNWNVSLEKDTFSPVARYYPDIDIVLYLNEDCSYRSDRVDTYLTVLWHPQDDRLVGIKVKGFRFLFQQIKAMLESLDIRIEDRDFMPLVSALEAALVNGVGESIINKVEPTGVKRRYEEAMQLVRTQKARIQRR